MSIFAYFLLAEAKSKVTKKQKKSSDMSLLLLYPAGGTSFLLLYPAGENTFVLLSLAGKQFDLTYLYREETNYNGKNKYKFVSSL